MIRSWFEVIAAGPVKTAEKVTAILIDRGSPGVWEDEQDGKGILKAYIPADSSLNRKKIDLNKELKKYSWTSTVSLFDNQDWLTKWKEHIKPIRISQRLIIKPTWKKIARKPGRIIVEIDPGMAFGTGSHASTMMCLKAADRLANVIKGSSILDVGTGSGILAIAAARLGAKQVVGIDIDPEALKVARENVRLNNVNKKVVISTKPLEKINGKFLVIFANIIAEELIKIAAPLKAKMVDNGFLILSGILQERADEVVPVYKGLGFRFFKAYTKGEWVCLIFLKNILSVSRSHRRTTQRSHPILASR